MSINTKNFKIIRSNNSFFKEYYSAFIKKYSQYTYKYNLSAFDYYESLSKKSKNHSFLFVSDDYVFACCHFVVEKIDDKYQGSLGNGTATLPSPIFSEELSKKQKRRAEKEVYEEFKRNRKRLEIAIAEISTCAISGAVGTFANIDPRVESFVAKKLDLKVEPVSTQIIPRDRHALYFSVLAIIAGSVERVATEIRNLQRTEIQEVEEFFDKNQKGSSAMPHKKNPILSENLTGLSRMIRSYAVPALENISLWHERDISHSSVERNIGPDSTITLDFSLNRLKNILNNINVYPQKMLKNLNFTNGLIFSQRVMLELTKYGFSREKAYKIVQVNAQNAWRKKISLYESLTKEKLIRKKISDKNLKKMFDIDYHTKKIDFIFNRVFK